MRCQVSREHSKIEKWPSVRGYDPWDLEREGIPVDAENRPLWLGVSGQILWKRKWKNGFLLIRTCLSTLILKHFLRKRCLLCFDGSSCLSSGSLYIFHRTLSMMVHTWWCLEHTRTKDHLTKVWIPLWIHMALASILILTQGLNWLSSSVALLELGWARTSCSRKLAHLCSLAVSECTSIQTPIWELEGGLHPCCRPSGVDRGNDSVPDHPPGTVRIIRDLHVSSSQSWVWVTETLKAFYDAEEMEGSHVWGIIQRDSDHLQLRLELGGQAPTHRSRQSSL